MDIKLLRKAMIRDLSINEIIIMIAKIIGAISLSSLIYSFCKNISMLEIKIAIAFLKAKFFGLFIIDYEVAYTSKYGYSLKGTMQSFLGDSYVSEALLKYKFSLYEGLLLALFMLLVVSALLGHLWFETRSIIENKIYRTLEINQSTTIGNTLPQAHLKSSLSNRAIRTENKIIVKRKDKTPKEFQDI